MIEVIVGPMFSGKTEELLRRIKRETIAGGSVVVFKPSIDDRHSEDVVKSHDDNSFDAVTVSNPLKLYRVAVRSGATAIAIDEVQFFDQSIVRVAQKLSDNGFRVICSGLDKDAYKKPFPVSGLMMAIAQKVCKLTAVCSICGCEATETFSYELTRSSVDDLFIRVGGRDIYEARCASCHS
jgi:thymidine kinase